MTINFELSQQEHCKSLICITILTVSTSFILTIVFHCHLQLQRDAIISLRKGVNFGRKANNANLIHNSYKNNKT